MISQLHGGLVFPEEEQRRITKQYKQEGSADVEEEEVKGGEPALGGGDDINQLFNPRVSSLSLDDRVKLCASVGEEVIKESELRELLSKKDNFICYDGFEPSGRMHIAQGIMKTINVNKITDAGGIFVFWVADWFALMNNKMDGDIEKIKTVGMYLIEIWKACGMNLENVKFLWASDEINKRPDEYWTMVLDIARKNNISRIKRCAQIMGRKEGDDLAASQIFYPCMQAADIFFLKADVCQLGMDQRKVNMLAREYVDDAEGDLKKPVIISHPMLMGLLKDQEKMSKSDPRSAIFMEDTAKDVKKKINNAWCEIKDVAKNPVLNYTKNIIFGKFDSFEIKRPEEWGGNIVYNSYETLEQDWVDGKLNPEDLKPNVARVINEMLEPVRKHFETDPHAKKLAELVKSWRK